jgi:hypothetical protein
MILLAASHPSCNNWLSMKQRAGNLQVNARIRLTTLSNPHCRNHVDFNEAESESELGSASSPLTMDMSLPGLFLSKI